MNIEQILKTKVTQANLTEFTPDEIKSEVAKWGVENVENDYEVDLLVFYPDQVIDARGEQVTLTEENIITIIEESNKYLDSQEHSSFFDKLRRRTKEAYIAIQEDHNISVRANIGRSIGRFELGYLYDNEKNKDVPVAYLKAKIVAPHAKMAVKRKQYLKISGTIREDWTVAEVSFVTNGALKYAAALSEPSADNAVGKMIKEREKCFAQLSELSTQIKVVETTKSQINHELNVKNYVTELIYSGKIKPRDKVEFTNGLLKMSESNAKQAYVMMSLSEPVINLRSVNVRNRSFMEGLKPMEDFNKIISDLQNGVSTVDSLIAGAGKAPAPFKAQLSENLVNQLASFIPEDKKADFQKVIAQLSEDPEKKEPKKEEPKDDDKKAELAKLSEEYTAKLSEQDKKIAELSEQHNKLLSEITKLNESLGKLGGK